MRFGATDQTIALQIFNSDGTPKTDATAASAGLAIYYQRQGGSLTQITPLSDLAATNSAHSDGGLIHTVAQSYRFDLPDVFGTGADWVEISGAITDGVIVPQRIYLTQVDHTDAQRIGLASLPAAGTANTTAPPTAADNANAVWSAATRTLTAFGFTVTVGANNDKTGYSLTQTFPANFAALGINASGHLSRVVVVDTTTTNADMRGTDGANTVAPDNAAIAAAAASAAAVDAKLTTARVENLDRDIAHAGDAATYRADVSALLTAAAFTAALPDNFAGLLIDVDGRVTTNQAAGAATKILAIRA